MKTVLKNYSFVVSTKVITLTDVATIRLDRLALITDVTTGKILYNFADSTVSTATVSTNTITLSALQGGEANADKLRIDYDADTADAAFGNSTNATQITSSVLPTGAATQTTLAAILTRQNDGSQNTVLGAGSSIIGKVTTDQTTHGTTDLVAADVTKVGGQAVNLTDTGTLGVGISKGGNSANVKAASTAAATTDTALVVAISPNNTVPVSLASVPSHAVTNAGTFAVQATLQTQTDTVMVGGVNVKEINAVAPLMGNGVTGTGSQRVTVASDNTPFGINVGSKTSGGATTFTQISAATTNAASVKASAGTLYGIQASNTGAAVAFLKIFNKASAPTVGTDTAVLTYIIPAGGGIVVSFNDIGAAFGTGIATSVTGVATTADTTAVALAQVVINLQYA